MLMTTQMGPVISHGSRDRIHGMIEKAKKEGAKVRTGGVKPAMPKPFDAGCYYAPTVLEVDTTMEIWREEVFGPVVVAVPFEDEEVNIKCTMRKYF